MKKIWRELQYFAGQKAYVIGLLLTAVISYATLLFHPTIGIDDTAFDVYFEEGVSPATGRWCIFLINKIFPLKYNPYFMEVAGLAVFCVSITLWCVIWYRLFGSRLSVWSYTAFACTFVSSPILSEEVVWYAHNGIYLGFGVLALATLASLEALRKGRAALGRMGCLAAGAALLTTAVGFYESLMVVYLMALIAVFMAVRMLSLKEYSIRVRDWLTGVFLVGVAAMALRAGIVRLMIGIFHLEDQTQVLQSRGLYEVLGWFDGSRTWQDFAYVMKQFWVKYYINGVAYFPITILVLGVLILLVLGFVWSLRRKDGWIFVSVLGMLFVPWMMPVLEGSVTFYRSSQYIPFLTAYVVLLLAWELQYRKQSKTYVCLRGLAIFLVFWLLYRQAYEMNKWLYIDAMKYENDKSVIMDIGRYIQTYCDASKPVCVVGAYEPPQSLQAEAYVPQWSRRYDILQYLVSAVDEDIFREYNSAYGYALAETPRLSFIEWGSSAFYGFDRELIKFWGMHGFTFVEDGSLGHYEEAWELMAGGPVWPQEGSIVEREDYIIVNFGEKRE